MQGYLLQAVPSGSRVERLKVAGNASETIRTIKEDNTRLGEGADIKITEMANSKTNKVRTSVKRFQRFAE